MSTIKKLSAKVSSGEKKKLSPSPADVVDLDDPDADFTDDDVKEITEEELQELEGEGQEQEIEGEQDTEEDEQQGEEVDAEQDNEQQDQTQAEDEVEEITADAEAEGDQQEVEGEEQEQQQQQVEEVAEVVIEEDQPTRTIISVDRQDCFRCSHLTKVLSGVKFKGSGKHIEVKPFQNCYWKNGNDNCPAKDLYIVIGVNATKFATDLIEREKANDIEGVNEKMAKLSRYDETIQKNVLTQKALLKIESQVTRARKSKLNPNWEFAMECGVEEGLFGYAESSGQPTFDPPGWYKKFVTERLGIENR